MGSQNSGVVIDYVPRYDSNSDKGNQEIVKGGVTGGASSALDVLGKDAAKNVDNVLGKKILGSTGKILDVTTEYEKTGDLPGAVGTVAVKSFTEKVAEKSITAALGKILPRVGAGALAGGEAGTLGEPGGGTLIGIGLGVGFGILDAVNELDQAQRLADLQEFTNAVKDAQQKGGIIIDAGNDLNKFNRFVEATSKYADIPGFKIRYKGEDYSWGSTDFYDKYYAGAYPQAISKNPNYHIKSEYSYKNLNPNLKFNFDGTKILLKTGDVVKYPYTSSSPYAVVVRQAVVQGPQSILYTPNPNQPAIQTASKYYIDDEYVRLGVGKGLNSGYIVNNTKGAQDPSAPALVPQGKGAASNQSNDAPGTGQKPVDPVPTNKKPTPSRSKEAILNDWYRFANWYNSQPIGPTFDIELSATLSSGTESSVFSIITLPNARGENVTQVFPRTYAETTNPPLIIDLDGDGIETISLDKSNAYFDYTKDGLAERTEWVAKDDALLAIDLNENNKIDNVDELFGYFDRTGFQDLKSYDTNNDSIIDSNDKDFLKLRVWQDLNEDGATDVGELKTLAEQSIQSINLKSKSEYFSVNGVEIKESSTVKKTNGTTLNIYDAYFDALTTFTKQVGSSTIPKDLMSLPWIKGYGALKDLLVIATNNIPLQEKIIALSEENDISKIYTQIDDLISLWSGVGKIGQNTSGTIDTEKLNFLSKYLGVTFAEGAETLAFSSTLESTYAILKNKTFIDFVIQTFHGEELGLGYSVYSDTYILDNNVFYNNLIVNLTEPSKAFLSFILVSHLKQTEQFDIGLLRNAIVNQGFGNILEDYANGTINIRTPDSYGDVVGTASDDILLPNNPNGGTYAGNDGNDFMGSTIVNDTLQGGVGNDTYALGLNSGTDLIDDVSGSSDQIILGAEITKDNLELKQSGNNLQLIVEGQTIANIKDWFVTPSIETIRFTNGDSLTATQISAMTATINGTASAESLTGNNYANTINGLGGDDTLTGGAGNDTLDGGTGADSMSGGTGDDSYIVDNTGDVITEKNLEGVDTVTSSVNYTLSSYIEDLTLTGSGNINATGNDSDNILTGNSGANVLTGGFGDDTYVIDTTDTVVENPNEGYDKVKVNFNYTLGANVEGLEFTGNTALTGTGNSVDNLMIANDAASTLIGGLGNDFYVVQNTGTVITENVDEGTDAVQSSVSYTLGNNIENIRLSGTANINATGNALNNILIGNDGVNQLTGGAGDDTYTVQTVGDTVVEGSGAGTDTVQSSTNYTLDANVENLILTGVDNLTGTGNTLANQITGNYGDNTLDGGSGADSLIGDFGDDTYVVDNAGDVVTENTDEGVDTVQTGISYTLGANVENITLTGSSNLSATGNSLNNVLTGNSGIDTLVGGTGNDTYVIQNASTVITENLEEGIDLVQTSVSYTLGSNVENIALLGTSTLTGTGNSLDNTLTGNDATSTLVGGAGNDTYVITNASTVITENSNEGTDLVKSGVSFTLGSNIENLTLTSTTDLSATGNTLNNVLTGNAGKNTLDGGSGTDTMLGGLGDDIYIVDNTFDVITEQGSEGIDSVQASADYTLANYVENLTLTGSSNLKGVGNIYHNQITGNTGNNVLDGQDGNDTLDGGGGVDTLKGGTGDDVFIVDSSTDVVTEAISEGIDTVQTGITYTLGSNVENLTLTDSSAVNGTGNALDNVLTGNSAANVLTGGAGNDTYVINSGDTVTDNANEGIDTVKADFTYTLGTNLENLTLTGTANINGTGNASDNILTGNTGTNTLTGGAGNDTYIIQNESDVVVESASSGTDTIQSSVNYTASANVENLTLTGTDNVNATGNSLDNILKGNDGNNILDGSTGADSMTAGLGNDTYVVDSTSDVITEKTGEGVDTVQSSITFSFNNDAGKYLENLTLTGSSAINATGNIFDNYLTGNSGSNVLTGLDGKDTLDGAAGGDSLIGGIGDDLYIVDDVNDIILENASEGTDTVQASTSYILSNNIENLTLTSTANLDGTGNILDNILTGNSGNNQLVGLDGNDTLDGGTGADSLIGGKGNDRYFVDNTSDVVTENADEGTDTIQSSVTFTLGNNIENLLLTGQDVINGTGNSLNNILVGNLAANTLTGNAGNDTLDGGAGVDSLVGGTGDDTYVVDNVGDIVTENSNEGSDLVQASVSYTLGNNLENLALIGTSSISGTGNSLNNIIAGNDGDNVLDGGAGLDTLVGGKGNDSYIVDDINEDVREALNEGTDTVYTSVNYTLHSDIENLVLTGTGNTTGSGNGLDNLLVDNAGNNTLAGGGGNDTYQIQNAGDVIVEEANAGTDTVVSSVSYTLGNNVENLTLSGTGNITATGNSLNNVLQGNIGTNTLTGSLGDDTYVINDLLDTLVENASEGTDTVQSSINYTLGTNFENLVLTGGASTGTGNTANNVLTGNSADNTLDGATGTDTLVGGLGNDTYIVDNASDVITENLNEGTDVVQSSVTYTLGANVENITLTGSGNINATGNSLDNILQGNSGTNTLSGGAGNDTYIMDNTVDTIVENTSEGTDTVQASVTYTLGTNVENLILTGTSNINATGNTLDNVLTGNTGLNTLTGGTGNDTYVIQNTGDVVVESASSGTDTIQTSVTYTASANIENLTLTGTDAISGTGNTLDNTLLGNAANNTLTALEGNDTLNGGLGIDTLVGGLGNDTYIVDSIYDTVTENASEGTDTVQSSVSYTLSNNVENLTLTGTTAINATGNTLNNTLTGNTADNILDGGTGNDTMVGGTGNDTYLVDSASDVVTENSNEGMDSVQSSVSYTLGSNVENITLTGSSNITATGNSLDNILTGNSGLNTLTGGTGNDTYIISDLNDTIVEAASSGTDTVQTSVSYTLGSELENITLTGTANINATGNSLNNTLKGNLGTNSLIGSTGNDTYIIDDINDVVVENASEGTDAVQSSVHYTLAANVENMTLTGTANINGTGNTLDNTLTGNTGNNVLVGVDGNDTLDGGVGADTMIGGIGNDTYYVDDLKDVVTENASEGTDTIYASVSYTMGANIENIIFTGNAALTGTGTAANNTLTGNAGDNFLDGGVGADTMIGASGNDTYVVDDAGDVVTENASEGTDTVQSSLTYTLGNNVENLTLSGTSNINATGNSLDNILKGNSGTNTLTGSTGNDTYVIDDLTDTLVEAASAGTDTVETSISYTLGANFENITLTGTGNTTATGNSVNNLLKGNSGKNTLDGGTGNDTMMGGAGDDTYIVDSTSDLVTENASEGVDLVQSSVSYTMTDYVENLTLTGTSNINATGNTYANKITGNTGNNSIVGGAGNDTLDGFGGADTLVGGTGDDTFVVDSANDVVTENGGEGLDTIMTSLSVTLGTYFENLTLTGSTNATGTGNAFQNVLTGNTGANLLTGLDGNDTLDGGVGIDTLVGGLGDDIYYVDNVSDIVTENANEGTDTVISTVSYVMGENIENLQLNSTGNISGTGNSKNNVITGNSANNILDGGAGADTMIGAAGDDTYVVDDAGDVVVEAANEGTDSIQSTVDWTLGNNIENLTLAGTVAINATGNTLNNKLTGNDNNNLITALAGNDTVDGGIGADTLLGGTGDDTYVVDSLSDIIVENASEGIDSVQSSQNFTLSANLENLTLTGSTATYATGNSLNNKITSNSASNVLDGQDGDDTYVITSGGNDTIVDSSGNDTIDFSSINKGLTIDLNSTMVDTRPSGNSLLLFTGADNSQVISDPFGNTWTAQGDAKITSTNPWKTAEKSLVFDGNGDALASSLVPNGDNFTIRFRMRFDNTTNNQTLFCASNGASYELLIGSGQIRLYINNQATLGTQTNLVANQWYEFEFNFSTTDGYRVFIDGQQDIYNSSTTKISSPGSLIFGKQSNYGFDGPLYLAGAVADVYYTNSERLHNANFTPLGANYSQAAYNQVHWSSGAIENAVGGTGNDTITGTSGANLLTGNAGNDSLVGGDGNDTYAFGAGFGTDTITDSAGTDTFDFSAFTTSLNISLANTSFTESTGNTVNWSANVIENLVTGSGNDTLTGSTGANSLSGGAGDDTYKFVSGFGLDTINDSAGSDTLDFSGFTAATTASLANTSFTESTGNTVSWTANALENITGGTGNDTLTGTTADNILTGGSGNDSLIGDAGNDTYKFATGFGTDTINDASGLDTIDLSTFTSALSVSLANTSFTQSAGNVVNWSSNAIENLTTGSGSDTLTGNTLDNILTGNAGNDSLVGDTGNDTYKFTTGFGTDTINDASGSDTIDLSAFTTDLSVNLGNTSFTQSSGNVINWGSGTIENLTTGGGNDSLTGTSGDNVLKANAGNDTLSGAAGNDSLDGGAGNDVYQFASGFGQDTLVDSDGIDQVDLSTLTSNLSVDLTSALFTESVGNTIAWAANSVENVSTGSGNDSITGNSSNNKLDGGAGNDTYVFASGFGRDTINDSAGTDLIDFSSFTNNMSIDISAAAFSNGDGNTLSWSANAIDNVTSGTGNDQLIGNSLANVLTAGNGNDTLTGNDGNDTLNGGAGNDTYVFTPGGGSDSIQDSSGNDTLDFGKVDKSVTANLATNTAQTIGLPPGNVNQALLLFAGDDATQNISDAFGNLWTANGNAQISSTNPWKSGEKSIVFDGTGDYLSSTLVPNGDKFTLRFRFRADNTTTRQTLFCASNGASYEVILQNGQLNLYINNQPHAGTRTNLASNQWYEAEFNFSNTDGYRLFIDGQQDIYYNSTSKISGPGSVVFGTQLVYGGDGPLYMTGAIADVYYTNLERLHSANFSPLTDNYQTAFINTTTWDSGSMENLFGGTVNDTLTGNTSDNLIGGNAGNDTLSADAGNDTLQGGIGNDSLDGGTGNDVYQFSDNFGYDTITDSSGTDTIDFSTHTNAVTVDLSSTSMTFGTGTGTGVNPNSNKTLLNLNPQTNSSTNLVDIYGNTWTAYGNANIQSTDSWKTGEKYIALDGSGDYIRNTSMALTGDAFTIHWRQKFDALNEFNQLIQTPSEYGLGVDFYYNKLEWYLSSNGTSWDVSEGDFSSNFSWNTNQWYDFELSYSNTSGYKLFVDGNLELSSNITTKLANLNSGLFLGGLSTPGADVDGAIADIYVTNGEQLHNSNFTPSTSSMYDLYGSGAGSSANSVTWSTNAIENATGSIANDTLTGNSSNNVLQGKEGNDTLNGGAGTDTLMGGAGNDTYIVDSTTDTITENTKEGTDTVQSSVTHTLGSNVENLTLIGSGNINGTGNSGDNILTGNSGNNSLSGGAGNDTLNGGSAGTDTLAGGQGDDIYLIETATVSVSENASEGIDTIMAAITYTLGSNLENLTLTGSTNINGTGNTLDNILTGNNKNNSLSGSSGNDTYQTFGATSGNDTISDSAGTLDNAIFNALTTAATWSAVDTNADTFLDQLVVTFDVNNKVSINNYFNNTATTVNASTAGSGAIETLVFKNDQSVTFSDVQSFISPPVNGLNLTGTSANETLTGGTGNDTLKGQGGNDSLVGSSGNDTYRFGNSFGTDTISDSSGTDTLDFSAYTAGLTVNLTTTGVTTSGGGVSPNSNKTLLNLNGQTNGSATMVDIYGNTWTAYGNANIQSASSWKSGEKYIELDGNGDYIRNTSMALTGNSFTVHWRQKFDALNEFNQLIQTPADYGFGIDFYYNKLEWYLSSNGTSWDISEGDYSANFSWNTGQWYDFEFTYSNTSGYKLFVDGVQQISSNSTSKLANVSSGIFLGGLSTPGADVDGAIADIYVTNGEQLHSSAFTPSTSSMYDLYGSGGGGSSDSVTWGANVLENVIGSTGADTLTGNSSANQISGGAGNDTLSGGTGNDTYKFAKGDGLDTINDTGNSADTADKVLFDSTVIQSEVALWMNGGNLEIGYSSNSTDKITIQSQTTAANTIERLELNSGYYLTDANINQIIQDMTAYATNHSISLTSLNDVKNDANLLAIVNSGWHT